MKTPREILLARHMAVEPKLDKIRQDLVTELNNKGPEVRNVPRRLVSLLRGFPNAFWRELILPSRAVWVGLAAVWLLILAANFSMRDHSQPNLAKSFPSTEMIVAFRQQQQLLSELIGPDNPPVAEAKKSYLPRPASKRQTKVLMA